MKPTSPLSLKTRSRGGVTPPVQARNQEEEVRKSKEIFPRSLLHLGLSVPTILILATMGTAQAQFLPPQPLSVPPPISDIPVIDTQGYTLGVGDRIQIDIFNVPEYSGDNGKHQVSIDGSLNLPLIGRVVVQGLGIDQAKDIIQKRYGEYLKRPLIELKLIAARPLQVAVTGEVQRPGSYILSSATATGNSMLTPIDGNSPSLRLPTVTRVLQMAGGITPSADVRQVKIRRSNGQSGEQILNLDLWQLLQTGDLSQDITLRDGDTIYIPTTTEHNSQESSQLVAANFASTNSQPINVAVVGEVNRPGTHILALEVTPSSADAGQTPDGLPLPASGGGFTVTKALKQAGGITAQADIRQIVVRRITRTGTEQQIAVDLWKLLQEGDLNQDVMLQQGDTIVVPAAKNSETGQDNEVAVASFSPDSWKISIVGEVVSPGARTVVPNTSLNQAIMAAGGFNEARANKKEVELIRLHSNGTVSRRQVQINLSAEVNEETNPILRNNDVILVGRSGGAAFRDGFGTVLNSLSPINNFLGLFRFVNIF